MKIEVRKLTSDEFPAAICELPDPPEELYVSGKMPDQNEYIYLAVVGSRKNSRYGKEVCESLVSGLRGYPIVIVSGLALGIDGIAHRSAIFTGLKTVAIPGSGLSSETIYPRTHLGLAEEILRKGGALLSEFPPEFKATEWSFPQRNRIMAGLSRAVLIIEAEEKSGTLITARLALDYNRDVLAVPGDIFSPNSSGTNRLIREGATPITKSGEILLALGIEPTETGKTKPEEELIGASINEKIIWKILCEPMSRENLLIRSGLNIRDLNTAISLLEIKGFITENTGEIKRKFWP